MDSLLFVFIIVTLLILGSLMFFIRRAHKTLLELEKIIAKKLED